jgi:hypothetical protein
MNSVGPQFGPRSGMAGLAQQLKRPDGPSWSAHGARAQRTVTTLETGVAAGAGSGDMMGRNGGGGHQPGKVVGGRTHRGDATVWRWREAVGATEFKGGEALQWGTTATEGSCGTPMMRGR